MKQAEKSYFVIKRSSKSESDQQKGIRHTADLVFSFHFISACFAYEIACLQHLEANADRQEKH